MHDIEVVEIQHVERVNHPDHYNQNGLETIDIIEAFCSDLNGIEGFDIGNCLKYLTRWKHKNGIEDLKKAKWYLEHAIKYEESRKGGINA